MEDINIPIVEERNPDGQISKIERLPASPWWLDAELVTVILLVFLGIGTFSLLTSSYQLIIIIIRIIARSCISKCLTDMVNGARKFISQPSEEDSPDDVQNESVS